MTVFFCVTLYQLNYMDNAGIQNEIFSGADFAYAILHLQNIKFLIWHMALNT